MSSGLVAPPPAFGMTRESGLTFADLRVPEPPELEEALLVPGDVRPARGVVRVVACAAARARSRPGSSPAVLAVAHPGAGPAVDEDAVDVVAAA